MEPKSSTHPKSRTRLSALVVLFIAGCCALSSCASPEAKPTPAVSLPPASVEATSPSATPAPSKTTVSMDDPEIAALFHQAERAFTAYIDARSAMDYTQMETVEKVYGLTSGTHLSQIKSEESEGLMQELKHLGKINVLSITPLGLDASGMPVLQSCIDVSQTDIVDKSNQSVVSDQRPSVQSIEVDFLHDVEDSSKHSELLVSRVIGHQGSVACPS